MLFVWNNWILLLSNTCMANYDKTIKALVLNRFGEVHGTLIGIATAPLRLAWKVFSRGKSVHWALIKDDPSSCSSFLLRRPCLAQGRHRVPSSYLFISRIMSHALKPWFHKRNRPRKWAMRRFTGQGDAMLSCRVSLESTYWETMKVGKNM